MLILIVTVQQHQKFNHFGNQFRIEDNDNKLNLLQRISIKPVIFTFREEGKSDNKVVNVKEILEMAIRNGCSYVDLELGNKINSCR